MRCYTVAVALALAIGMPGVAHAKTVAKSKLLTQAEAAADDEDWSEARTLYKKAAAAAKASGKKVERRTALEGLVKALTALQDYSGALAIQKELTALDTGSGSEAVGQRKLDGAVLAVYAHELDQATNLLDEADRSFTQAEQPGGRAKAAYYRAIVYQRQGRYAEELASYGRSRGFSKDAGNAREAARRLHDIGNVYKELVPDFPKAQAAFDAAISELDQIHDAPGVLDVEIDKGNLYIAAGRIEDAVSLLDRARGNIPKEDARPWIRVTQILANAHYRAGGYDLARGLIDETRAVFAHLPSEAARAPYVVDADNLVALIDAELGRTDEAVKGFDKALATATKFDLKGKQSIVLNNLGYWLREAGRADQAITRLQQALTLDKGLKADEGIAYDQRNLGLALVAAGRAAEAKQPLQAALSTSTRLGMVHNAAWCHVGLGATALAGGDAKGAEDDFKKGYESAGAAQLPDLQWRAATGLARALVKEGKADEAFTAYENALTAIDSLEESLGSDAARRGFKGRHEVAQVFKEYAQALAIANRSLDAERVRRRAEPRTVAHVTNTAG